MMNKIKSSLKGIVKGDLFLTLNQLDKVLIVESNIQLSVFDKSVINSAVKKVNKSLLVFFR